MFSKYLSSNKQTNESLKETQIKEELSSENLIVLFLILVPLWILIAVFVDDIIDQIREKKVITIECKLLNRNTGVSRYGEQHGFTTFNCGDYGVLISDNKEIFRKAKENNKLNVYFGKNYYKIFSIKE
jgi:hypothetical protein